MALEAGRATCLSGRRARTGWRGLVQRQYRLRESADFQRTRQQGRSYQHPLLALYARRSGAEVTRAGISVSKRLGKAVTRNRVKRRVREALRLLWPRVQPGWDLLLVGRAGASGAGFQQIKAAVEQVLQRAGVLGSDGQKRAVSPAGSSEASPAHDSGRPGPSADGWGSDT